MAIVLDLFNREVVVWSLKPCMTADIVTGALTMGWCRRKPAVGLIHHSDRSSQYASQPFQGKLKAYGMKGTMSRMGNCWDNAPTKSLFDSFKSERVHGLRNTTRAEMTAATLNKSDALALDARLQVTDIVSRSLAFGSIRGKLGSMNLVRWKTKSRGKLKVQTAVQTDGGAYD